MHLPEGQFWLFGDPQRGRSTPRLGGADGVDPHVGMNFGGVVKPGVSLRNVCTESCYLCARIGWIWSFVPPILDLIRRKSVAPASVSTPCHPVYTTPLVDVDWGALGVLFTVY